MRGDVVYLTQPLHRHLRAIPDATAMQDERTTLTWRELGDAVMRFAGALRRDGLQPGDRVAMMARNSVDFAVYVIGTLWAGGVINPVNLRWAPAEMAYSLNDCQTRFLIVHPEFLPLVGDLRERAPCLTNVIVLGSEGTAGVIGEAEWLRDAPRVDDALRRGDDLAAIMYTGGTTGRSKGVMLSHSNIAFANVGTRLAMDEAATRRPLHVAPLFHIGALSNFFVSMLTGATSTFIPAFDPEAVITAIERWRITEVFLVPTMLRMVIDQPGFATRDVSSLERIRYGASPIDATLLARVMAAFPNTGFSQGYGMTELAPTAVILPPADHLNYEDFPHRLASAGRATPVCEVRIVGSDGHELPVGEVGEIAVRGPTVMLGYWNLPEATAEAIRDGWMHTGDLGFMDADGYVTVVDRLKDMIVSGGENVYSSEVEKALASHPAVEQVAVIPVPDEKWGERVHAVVVLRSGAGPAEQELVDHCRPTIAAYKLPRSFSFVDALPLTAAGKPLKAKLRELYSG